MKKFHMIAGLPRSGSTLLCNLLNMNKEFHATPTSGVVDILKAIRSNYSHNQTWKAQDRKADYENMRKGLKGFLDGYFDSKNIVFDKCRGWSANIALIDEILGHKDSKIIWTYRNPAEVIASIEAQYQKTLLLENADESVAPGAFLTLERRINTFTNNDSIVWFPVEILKDAIEMGYLNRILFVTYHDLTNNTQATLDRIHNFIGEKPIQYDLKNVKQSTFEFDGFYNYKFLHTIKEGEIKWKKSDVNLPKKYINHINERFAGLNALVFEGRTDMLIGPPEDNVTSNMPENPGATENPFSI